MRPAAATLLLSAVSLAATLPDAPLAAGAAAASRRAGSLRALSEADLSQADAQASATHKFLVAASGYLGPLADPLLTEEGERAFERYAQLLALLLLFCLAVCCIPPLKACCAAWLTGGGDALNYCCSCIIYPILMYSPQDKPRFNKDEAYITALSAKDKNDFKDAFSGAIYPALLKTLCMTVRNLNLPRYGTSPPWFIDRTRGHVPFSLAGGSPANVRMKVQQQKGGMGSAREHNRRPSVAEFLPKQAAML